MSSKAIGELARSRSLEYVRSSRKRKRGILDEFDFGHGCDAQAAIADSPCRLTWKIAPVLLAKDSMDVNELEYHGL